VHRRRGRGFEVRCGDDRRHVQKHERRYLRATLGPRAAGELPPRSLPAALWRRLAKPIYNRIGSRLGLRDREPRRTSSGPWPRWVEAGDREP
jgi:hypothetical protein